IGEGQDDGDRQYREGQLPKRLSEDGHALSERQTRKQQRYDRGDKDGGASSRQVIEPEDVRYERTIVFADGIMQAGYGELKSAIGGKPVLYRCESPQDDDDGKEDEGAQGPEKAASGRLDRGGRFSARLPRKPPDRPWLPESQQNQQADDGADPCQYVRQGGSQVIGGEELDDGERETRDQYRWRDLFCFFETGHQYHQVKRQ